MNPYRDLINPSQRLMAVARAEGCNTASRPHVNRWIAWRKRELGQDWAVPKLTKELQRG